MEKWQELMLKTLGIQCDLLVQIRAELRAIREATETEAVEDAEDQFQTLNGPNSNPTYGGIKPL